MTIEDALYSHLCAVTALAAIVGTKIYPAAAVQTAAMPYVVYQQIGDEPQHVLGGLPTLQVDVWQFSAYAGTDKQARAISTLIKGALRGFTGNMGGTGGVWVSGCIDSGRRNGYEGDPKAFFCHTDFQISHDAV